MYFHSERDNLSSGVDRQLPRFAMVWSEHIPVTLPADLKEFLDSYAAWQATSGPEARGCVLAQPVDTLIYWAESPPSQNLLAVIQNMSRESAVSLVVIANDSCGDSSLWLDAGAERCLQTPVTLACLQANLRVVHRHLLARSQSGSLPMTQSQPWTLKLANWLLIAPDGATMVLSKLELHFMKVMMGSQGQLIPRATVAAEVYAQSGCQDFQRMEMLISRLRKKTWALLNTELPVKSSYADGLIFLEAAMIVSTSKAE